MRSTLLILALLAVASVQMRGQSGFCPTTPKLEDDHFSEHWLEGSIGPKSVRMYLARGGEGVVGAFYYTEDWYTRRWVPRMLGGRWREGNEFEVADKTEQNPGTGRLDGRLTASGLVGTWTPRGGSENVPVLLKVVTQTHCEAGSGSWQRFSDPRWPITFSYPASWRVEEGKDSVTLTCPDPSHMAYEGHDIRLTQGTGADDIGLVRCGQNWYGKACDCEDLGGLSCRVAPIRKKGGMTILDGDAGDWRGYCRGGGYVGQADGHIRVLLIDGRWVQMSGQGAPAELIDQIVNTVRKRH